jgi:hypothetical protein
VPFARTCPASWRVEKMAAVRGHDHKNASKLFFCALLDGFLCIPKFFLGLPGYLFAEAFDLLLFAADQLSSFFLHLTGDVF